MEEQTVEELKKELEIANKKIAACKSVIHILLRDNTNTRLELGWKMEMLLHQHDCIRAEAKRWKQEYKNMAEASAVRHDTINDLLNEIQRLDKRDYHKPF